MSPAIEKKPMSKTQKRIIILSVILAVMAILTVKHYMNRPEEVPDGALIVVMCDKCGAQYIERVVDINSPDCVCKFCGGKLGHAHKCAKCDFEYCVKPHALISERGRTMDLFKLGARMNKCPNCGSENTGLISVSDFKEKKK